MICTPLFFSRNGERSVFRFDVALESVFEFAIERVDLKFRRPIIRGAVASYAPVFEGVRDARDGGSQRSFSRDFAVKGGQKIATHGAECRFHSFIGISKVARKDIRRMEIFWNFGYRPSSRTRRPIP